MSRGADAGSPPGIAAPTPNAPLETLTRRQDFLACARARKWVAPGLILQARQRPPGGPETARVGYTCSKKIGNAVTRNRAKRRLREAARARLRPVARPGWDYVLIGRPKATVGAPFTALLDDLSVAISRLHRPPKPRAKPPQAEPREPLP